MKRLVLACLVVVMATILVVTTALAQTKPQFQLGFKGLADQIPQVAGEPNENEHWGANGDSLQTTTTGLMAWRAADNWTAFTNGSRTWVNGPSGVMERANEERFAWEAPSPPPGVGNRITLIAAALTVNSCGKIDKIGGYVPKAGSTFLVVDVTIENINRVKLSYSMGRFSVKAADGYIYTASYRSLDRELEMGAIGRGEITRGRISFEVPTNAKRLTLLWDIGGTLDQYVIKAGLE